MFRGMFHVQQWEAERGVKMAAYKNRQGRVKEYLDRCKALDNWPVMMEFIFITQK
jgi:hypothetical protein